ncbi:LLM class F420-dependent oxidoreductase [Amycolatopsis sp. DG1A-15b]|uniref:LLM class F420-dependent oxidoreductase n=1 Tax=Amycolatopsis sp. DG1A-15b TaxID=3052846 RepID=UPI00255B4C5F|nr:LLM class F420-dependent oxidoreductase [Amycolatopsis sp. DG1A-15b]WIX92221.1 LLM class F420-dependent oxidoreductase [Amycolatopsis sp. DG1A-15b]
MAIKHGVFLPQGFSLELAGMQDPAEAYQALTRVAKAAEENGYETVWVADHLHNAMNTQHMLFECWTTSTALLTGTERLRVGTMVTGNGYRNPALQAKMASTLDVISGGRFTFGIGAGWWEPDYLGYGYEYPDAAERLRRLDEALQVILAMWTQEEAKFDGKYYQVNSAINQPKGIQQPHIPLLIAGGGEKVTLKLVAKYGDLCNVSGDPATLAHKFEVLKNHCTAVGRDFDSIHKTALTLCIIADTDEEAAQQVPPWAPSVFPGDVAEYGLIGTIDTVRDRLAAYEAAGVDELVITFVDALELTTIERYAQEFLR